MNIRLYNARILTMEPGREVFYGEIWVKNDKIAYVAGTKRIKRRNGTDPSSRELPGILNWTAREIF